LDDERRVRFPHRSGDAAPPPVYPGYLQLRLSEKVHYPYLKKEPSNRINQRPSRAQCTKRKPPSSFCLFQKKQANHHPPFACFKRNTNKPKDKAAETIATLNTVPYRMALTESLIQATISRMHAPAIAILVITHGLELPVAVVAAELDDNPVLLLVSIVPVDDA
jgi:hypothetical protein